VKDQHLLARDAVINKVGTSRNGKPSLRPSYGFAKLGKVFEIIDTILDGRQYAMHGGGIMLSKIFRNPLKIA
jgi:hypothetical protein